MRTVFEFIDFRVFLAYYYAEKKKLNRHFSFRSFADKAAIRSPSFLKHVIDGKRNLTRSVAEKVCSAMSLAGKETQYFLTLVRFNQAKTALEKQEHYALLRTLAGCVKEALLKERQYEYFAQWYNPVIRELVCIKGMANNYEKLAKNVVPSITTAQARKSVAMLRALNLITRTSSGGYIQIDSALVADPAVTSMAVSTFTDTMLQHARQALRNVSKSQRHISGVTMGISKAAYDMILAEIDAFKDRAKTIANRDQESDRVYQMNVSFFPVSTLSESVEQPDQEQA